MHVSSVWERPLEMWTVSRIFSSTSVLNEYKICRTREQWGKEIDCEMTCLQDRGVVVRGGVTIRIVVFRCNPLEVL